MNLQIPVMVAQAISFRDANSLYLVGSGRNPVYIRAKVGSGEL